MSLRAWILDETGLERAADTADIADDADEAYDAGDYDDMKAVLGRLCGLYFIVHDTY